MKCHLCGSPMHPVVTDLPFKTDDHAIVIIKGLPVIQCDACREYLIKDDVMRRVEKLLANSGAGAELEVVRFAA